MRIALVCDSVYPFNKGGRETRSFGLAKRLAEMHDVDFYTMNFWGRGDLRFEGVVFRALSRRMNLYKNGRRSFFQAIWFGLSSFRMFFQKFDVLDADHMAYFHLFPLWAVCKFKRKRFVASWHEVWGYDLWRRYLGFFGVFGYFLERLASKLPDRIISVSQETSRRLSQQLGVDSRKIYTIPNAIDFGNIRKSKKADFSSDIIFVGRLESHKRVDLIIDAVELLRRDFPDIRFLIVGRGSERKRLEKMVFEKGLENNVFFKDDADSDEDVFGLMKASKVFVLASNREGFGIVVLEANACGLPVICSNYRDNAARFLIEDGKNGFVCEPNKEGLSHYIKKVLTGRKMKSFCLKKAKDYDWGLIIDKFEEVYFS